MIHYYRLAQGLLSLIGVCVALNGAMHIAFAIAGMCAVLWILKPTGIHV
jgi:uncharacterized membrane protein